MLYLLTPTGGRPEGLAMLGESINAQTYQGEITWVIVDDCEPRTEIPQTRAKTRAFYPATIWSDELNTQASSMSAGLALVPNSGTLVVMEDDDYYAPEHIENVLDSLKTVDLTGERVARYYNIRSKRYGELTSNSHASMASSACKGEALRHLKRVCMKHKSGLDMHLWQCFKGSKRLLDSKNVVGIKGLPGRAGIGVGHRDTFGTPDSKGVLAQWVGADRAAAYGRIA